MNAAALRVQIESAWGSPFPAPLTFRAPPPIELVPSGCAEIDALTGGLPRGGLTEICGPASSGRASLGLSLLARLTALEEACAWVDASDAFDPHSAKRMGAALDRLLWVRCQRLEQAIQAADLLLESGGFGLVALDLCGVPPGLLYRLPLSLWFRFRRAVERTPTIFLVLAPEPCAKSCSSLVLGLNFEEACWNALCGASPAGHFCLLEGARLSAEAARSRFQRPGQAISSIRFRTATGWNYRRASIR